MKKNLLDLNGKTILVTGSPGFIGAALVQRLLKEMSSGTIISLDSMNDYYEISLKQWRLRRIEQTAESAAAEHVFLHGNLVDKAFLTHVFDNYRPSVVVNLAAQAGVRYSIAHPDAYMDSNVIGFFNILEMCRYFPVEHLIYASSSSVYGGNRKTPFSTNDLVDLPVSLYAATKKSDELFAHSYSVLYQIPTTGLRFFTVYGPAGRPDMFYYSATQKLISGKSIQLYNYGNCQRDFTYIDDVIEGILRVIQGAPTPGSNPSTIAPYALYNIGFGSPVSLMDFVDTLQEELVNANLLPAGYNFDAHYEYMPLQPGDIPITWADCSELERDFGFQPSINLRHGLRSFIVWFKEYYKG